MRFSNLHLSRWSPVSNGKPSTRRGKTLLPARHGSQCRTSFLGEPGELGLGHEAHLRRTSSTCSPPLPHTRPVVNDPLQHHGLLRDEMALPETLQRRAAEPRDGRLRRQLRGRAGVAPHPLQRDPGSAPPGAPTRHRQARPGGPVRPASSADI